MARVIPFEFRGRMEWNQVQVQIFLLKCVVKNVMWRGAKCMRGWLTGISRLWTWTLDPETVDFGLDFSPEHTAKIALNLKNGLACL